MAEEKTILGIPADLLPPPTLEKPVFVSPSGDKIREFFQWNADETELVKVGEENIQEAMDERAKGCTIAEQIARLARGDMSMLKGEGLYADVYEYPEHAGDAQMKAQEALETLQILKDQADEQTKKAAQDKAELDQKVAALQAELQKLKGVGNVEGDKE